MENTSLELAQAVIMASWTIKTKTSKCLDSTTWWNESQGTNSLGSPSRAGDQRLSKMKGEHLYTFELAIGGILLRFEMASKAYFSWCLHKVLGFFLLVPISSAAMPSLAPILCTASFEPKFKIFKFFCSAFCLQVSSSIWVKEVPMSRSECGATLKCPWSD